jgi:imidazolonepropionase-like amidohydrolase
LLDMGVDGIKIRTGLTLDDVVAAVQAARRRGRPVYGHASELDARGNPVYTMDDAIRAGVAGVMHLNFDAPVDPERLPPRPPEPQGEANWLDWWLWANSLWLYSDPARETARIRALVEQRVWVEPTLAIQEELGRPEAASDADYVLPLNAAQRELYFRALRETMRFVARFHEAGGIIIAGTDNGRIHDELRLLVASGLSPQAALHAATRDAARALGWQDRVGTIEAGKFADLLILDADPLQDIANAARVWRVVKGGLLYDPARLK